MKKWIALLLVSLVLLCGCGKETATPTEPPETTEAEPTPVGTLYVSFGAALEITYDDDGNALTLTGTNEAGKSIAEVKQDQLNKGCVYTLRSILRYVITENLFGDTKTVTVRIGAADPLPTPDFLEVIGMDCQYLLDEELDDVDMYCLFGDMLDEQGNITFDTAQMLAGKFLKVGAIGEATPTDGLYLFTAGDRSCTVDAFTGLVTGK